MSYLRRAARGDLPGGDGGDGDGGGDKKGKKKGLIGKMSERVGAVGGKLGQSRNCNYRHAL